MSVSTGKRKFVATQKRGTPSSTNKRRRISAAEEQEAIPQFASDINTLPPEVLSQIVALTGRYPLAQTNRYLREVVAGTETSGGTCRVTTNDYTRCWERSLPANPFSRVPRFNCDVLCLENCDAWAARAVWRLNERIATGVEPQSRDWSGCSEMRLSSSISTSIQLNIPNGRFILNTMWLGAPWGLDAGVDATTGESMVWMFDGTRAPVGDRVILIGRRVQQGIDMVSRSGITVFNRVRFCALARNFASKPLVRVGTKAAVYGFRLLGEQGLFFDSCIRVGPTFEGVLQSVSPEMQTVLKLLCSASGLSGLDDLLATQSQAPPFRAEEQEKRWHLHRHAPLLLRHGLLVTSASIREEVALWAHTFDRSTRAWTFTVYEMDPAQTGFTSSPIVVFRFADVAHPDSEEALRFGAFLQQHTLEVAPTTWDIYGVGLVPVILG